MVIIAHFRGLRFLAFSRRTLAAASDAFAAISLCFLGLRRFALAWPPLRPISDRYWETWSGSIRRTACAIHLIRAVESLCPQCGFSHSSQLLDGCLCSLRSRGQLPFRKTLLLPCWLPSSPSTWLSNPSENCGNVGRKTVKETSQGQPSAALVAPV